MSAPEVLCSGASLLATQTTSLVDIFLYHIPTYRFLDFPGEQNPSSKLPPAETMELLPSLMGCSGVMVSIALEIVKRYSKLEQKKYGSRHDRWLSSGQASCLISSFLPSRSTRIPLSLSISLPKVLFSGVSLLATKATSLVGILLYQMPTYRFLDFPGLKNPSSKLPPSETMISSLLPSRSTRIPLSLSISLPKVLFRGVSLLATQTTFLVGILLYQMPTYRFLDFPGLKNPSSKLPPSETMILCLKFITLVQDKRANDVQKSADFDKKEKQVANGTLVT
nr:Copia protein [Ipomoea batatas]